MGFVLLSARMANIVNRIEYLLTDVAVVGCCRFTADIGAGTYQSFLKTVAQFVRKRFFGNAQCDASVFCYQVGSQVDGTIQDDGRWLHGHVQQVPSHIGYLPHIALQACIGVDSDARLQRYVRQVPNVAWDLLDVAVKPTTIILDGAINLAPNLIAEDGSIALRITKEPFSHELCYRFQKALVSTSANVSGEPAAANYCDISQEILDAVDYVCHSRRQEHKPHTPSSIIKLAEDGEVTIIRK